MIFTWNFSESQEHDSIGNKQGSADMVAGTFVITL
jgi:hypothetical protein